jgi:glyoxylase-like metal-dependent hydrolase (beta-lactamase superfamily II)
MDPSSQEFHDARAALAACPVAAIRASSPAERNLSLTEAQLSRSYAMNPNVNGIPLPFPRRLLSEKNKGGSGSGSDSSTDIWLVGHHSEKSFGAMPYLVKGKHGNQTVSVLVDVPKFSKSAISAIESLLSILDHEDAQQKMDGPDYMFLTHVDDTAQHTEWKEHFPKLKRIFHASDLGENNWIGDESLEEVEVLLRDESNVMKHEILAFSLDGQGPMKIICNNDQAEMDESFAKIFKDFDSDFMILHTPGHSPGSISLLYKFSDGSGDGGGTLFTGDTFAYTTRGHGQMTGFPRYGNDLLMQSKTLECFACFCSQYQCIAPGHGHPRMYRQVEQQHNIQGAGCGKAEYDERSLVQNDMKHSDLRDAISELVAYNRV